MGYGADPDYLLSQQYSDGSRLSARARLHARFATNRYGFNASKSWKIRHGREDECVMISSLAFETVGSFRRNLRCDHPGSDVTWRSDWMTVEGVLPGLPFTSVHTCPQTSRISAVVLAVRPWPFSAVHRRWGHIWGQGSRVCLRTIPALYVTLGHSGKALLERTASLRAPYEWSGST
jgi:hypothetical protein